MPLRASAESLFDEDCPLCRDMAGDSVPGFWHLDGSHMDDDFPFSFLASRDEWEAEKRQFEKWMEEFKAKNPPPAASPTAS